ncbi:unnamed protein product [Brassicogethes aeneus]|uniref:Uncharacterized protein n=1 Tax=Brassicogethes aeneus TaxID=1431903 RepID=A0A9P0FLA7_BRAAE|nr:unnamed protein product [Brassicogethes aeneus]
MNIQNIEVIDLASTYEYVWNNFKVPWEEIPEHMITMCEKGERNKYVISEIIHIVVNELRQIKELIPAKILKKVASDMCEKFPLMFRDIDNDGVVMADGSCTMFCKLHERASYLRRPHKRKLSTTDKVPPKLVKKKVNIMAGCSNWDDRSVNDDVDLKMKVNTCGTCPADLENFHDLLEKTYGDQRQFLNNIQNPPTVLEIKKEWPVLFKEPAIIWHFQKLTSKDLNTLPTIIEKNAQSIKKFGVKIKKLQGNEYEDWETSLKFVANYFNEDLNYFYYKTKEDDNAAKSSAPCVIEIENKNEFFVFMENEKVLEVKSGIEGIKIAFGLYFIFNLQYPHETSLTLEFIQRFFMKIHPDAGTGSKKNKNSKNKVITLINKLK